MNRATRITASVFGLFAGIGGIEHGYFEIQQGNAKPDSLMIASMGPPCEAEAVWHGCEPAMTVLPNFFITGVLAVILGVITMVWSLFFVQRKHGGLILILLSTLLLLFGGGIFPPLIGIIGGWVGTRIHTSTSWWRKTLTGKPLRFFAMLWPWTIILYFVLLFGQFVIGALFNDFLMQNGILILVLIPLLLVLVVISAFAKDVVVLEIEAV